MNTALLIIDVQNDYFPGGRMELFGSVDATVKIRELIDHFRLSSMPVVHVRHISVRKGAAFLLPGTPGAEIHDSVKPADGETIIVKNFPNSFRNTDLDSRLRGLGVSRLVIAGMMTHMCVDSTVRAAFDLGYECVVAGDCCATKALIAHGREIKADDVHGSFLAALNGTFSAVLDKDAVIELLK